MLKVAKAGLLFCFSVAVYAAAAMMSAVFPVPGRLQQPAPSARPIYVCADAIHADFVLPLHDELADWSSVFGEIAGADKPSGAYLSVGWGDLVFFTEVPTWGDVRPRHVLSGLAGQNPVTLRVVVVKQPGQNASCTRLQIDGAGQRALFNFIKESLASRGNPATKMPSVFEGYYEAKGRYGIFHTCNQWMADGLGAAGLPHAWFAPFSFGVMMPLKP
jgi:uncharacterized protein (TIGR02117 family)